MRDILRRRYSQIGSGENYQTQEISVLHRKLMEVRGTPEEEKEARDTTKDFAEWERLGAELPEIYSDMPPRSGQEPVRFSLISKGRLTILTSFFHLI